MSIQCSFKNASVPELIRMIEREIANHKENKAPICLKEILGCLEEANQILLRALVGAGPHNRKRIRVIREKQQEVAELKKQVESF